MTLRLSQTLPDIPESNVCVIFVRMISDRPIFGTSRICPSLTFAKSEGAMWGVPACVMGVY